MPRVLLIILVFSTASWAKISVPVPVSSYQNNLLQRLEALGCGTLGTTLLRPYASSDVRESLEILRESESCQPEPWLGLERDLLLRPVRENGVSSRFLWLGERNTVPLLAMDMNPRHPGAGATLWLEAYANAEMGQGWGVAFSALPGWAGALTASSSSLGKFYFLEGTAKVGYGRVELEFGRRQLGFGDPAGQGLLFSTAPPLDILRLAFRPGPNLDEISHRVSAELFIPVGPGEGSALGNLKVAGGGISLRPLDFLELGAYEVIQYADGANFELGDLPGAFFSYDETGVRYQRALAFAAGVWCPSFFCRVYGQVMVMADATLAGTEISPLVGVYFPQLGRLSLNFEYLRSSRNAFQQAGWPVPLSREGGILGHRLGADGDGLYLKLGLPALSRWRGELSFARETRGVSGAVPETRIQFGTFWRRRWLYMDLGLGASVATLSNTAQVLAADSVQGAFEAQFTYAFY